ncbi:MAG: DUF2520 domain-containing protein [Myxococcota bacterium]
MRVVVLGRGKVGRALARGWTRAGLDVSLRAGRAKRRAGLGDADACVLAVPDGAIDAVSEAVAPRLDAGAALFHCAGARGPDALGALPEGVHGGALHPMISFADPKRPPPLAGASFGLAGDPVARATGRRLVRALGAHAVEARAGAGPQGPAYHAAAALIANGAAALAAEAVAILEAEGVARRDAERMLGALLGSVAANVTHLGLPAALTGPVARGDAETVRAHRAAIGSEVRATYDAVGAAILRLARAQGLPEQAAEAVAEALADGLRGENEDLPALSRV